jgi:hypothetical protein
LDRACRKLTFERSERVFYAKVRMLAFKQASRLVSCFKC